MRIVSTTADYSDGYYSGPLYLKELDEKLVPSEMRSNLKIENIQPHWMPKGNSFYKIEKEGQMDILRQTVEATGKPLFDGAAEGIVYLKAHEEH